MPERGPRVTLDADLRLAVTAAGGGSATEVRVTGSGGVVTVDVADPAAVLAALPRTVDPRGIRLPAELAGTDVRVTSGDHLLATLRRSSRGGVRVRPSPRGVRLVAGVQVRRPRVRAALVAAGALVVLALLRAARR